MDYGGKEEERLCIFASVASRILPSLTTPLRYVDFFVLNGIPSPPEFVGVASVSCSIVTAPLTVQFVSGVNALAYWLSSYVWDIMLFSITVLLTVVVFTIFNKKEYIGDVEHIAVQPTLQLVACSFWFAVWFSLLAVIWLPL